MKIKKCSNPNCETPYQPVENFSKNKSRKDGLHPECRTCKRKRDADYYQRNREYWIEYAARYYTEHERSICNRERRRYHNKK